MVYVAGFATAVYVITPTEEGEGFAIKSKDHLPDIIQPDKFAQSVNVGLSKCADMSKTIAGHATAIIKQQLSEHRKNVISKE